MQISATSQLAAPVKAAPATRKRAIARTDDAHEAQRSGRRHVQRDLKHLVRDIRHQVKDEIKDLRASGAAGSDEKIEAVRAAYHDFRDQVQAVFHDAGRGRSFDASTVPDGLGQAMAAFTEALRALNGTTSDPADPVVDDTDPTVDPAKLPAPELAMPAGSLLDLTA